MSANLWQLRFIITLTACLAGLVVILGAYTRLTNAGLGCPDWPLCYGHFIVSPTGALQSWTAWIQAWTEMIHRYCASTLGLGIVIIFAMVLYYRVREFHFISILLLGLVLFQGILGMWTVTWKLYPLVVMGHLLGGMTILSILWTMRFRLTNQKNTTISSNWVMLAILIVFLQIALGGWVSSNYAGLACTSFPLCDGKWFSAFYSAFNIVQPIGANYQGGLLDIPARVTIQMVHRIGALITFLVISGLTLFLWQSGAREMKKSALILMILLMTQISLGIINVIYLLPLSAAVLHNAFAALLLLTLLHLYASTQKAVSS